MVKSQVKGPGGAATLEIREMQRIVRWLVVVPKACSAVLALGSYQSHMRVSVDLKHTTTFFRPVIPVPLNDADTVDPYIANTKASGKFHSILEGL
jgi:hypothetical protein